MDVAHSEYWTGSMVPAFSILSRSCSILSLRAYGTGLALRKMEVAMGSTWILAFVPCRVPRPYPNSCACFCKISLSRLSCEISSLILGQFSLISSSQFFLTELGLLHLQLTMAGSIFPLHNLRQLYTPPRA